MRQFIIDEDNLQAILQYLSLRPYAEVHQAIVGLQHLRELPPADAQATVEPE